MGFQAIRNFHKMLDKDDIPPEQMIRYQDDNVIMYYFGNREELTVLNCCKDTIAIFWL